MRTLLLVVLATGCDVLTPAIAPPSEAPATATAATKLTIVPDRGAAIDSIRVRVTFAAHAQPTRGDVNTATLVGATPLHPLAASSNLATLPIVIVDVDTGRTVDLYFPLPANASSIAVDWPLSTSDGPFALHAALELDADVSAERVGEHWWFAPGYAWSSFRHGDGVITREPPRSATVREIDRERDCDRW